MHKLCVHRIIFRGCPESRTFVSIADVDVKKLKKHMNICSKTCGFTKLITSNDDGAAGHDHVIGALIDSKRRLKKKNL